MKKLGLVARVCALGLFYCGVFVFVADVDVYDLLYVLFLILFEHGVYDGED